MLLLGIVAGLIAALAQAWTYLLSRDFVTRRGGALRLLGLGHLWMGLAALLMVPLVWMTPVAGWRALDPLAMSVGCYLAAQFFFYWTVRQVPASRVAPMMGAKVAILAVAVHLLGLHELSTGQWAAVGLTVLATAGVNWAGEPLPLRALAGVLATITAFAGSDLGIRRLILAIDPAGGVAPALVSASWVYACALLVSLALVARQGRPSAAELPGSLRYAGAWFVGMVALFTAISVDVVLAVMLQSLRGPVTVLFGALAARRREAGFEQVFTRAGLIRQLLAALLVTAGVGLYVLAERGG